MLTGVIYGAIVVVWAAYLVPLALRRHDEASRTRSIERFSSAMRVLARRGATATASARVVVTPGRKGSRVVTPDLGPEPERVLVTLRPNRLAEAAAASRRRRVLVILVATTLLVGAAAFAGVAPLWSPGVPALLVAVFLVAARRSVRRVGAPVWVEAPAADQTSGVVVRRPAVRVDTSRGHHEGEQAADEVPINMTAPEPREAPPGSAGQAIPAPSTEAADGGSLWDPLPVTLPTYVSAPVVKRTIRTVELGEPGMWSSGHSTDEAPAATTQGKPSAAAAPDGPAEGVPNDDEVTQEVPRVVNG
ncbi:MAG: hypothetical protein QOI06_1933 [Nocardioidaceae bacterium]|nr:hypothetical protein [Nocardioidaceae bacterium]